MNQQSGWSAAEQASDVNSEACKADDLTALNTSRATDDGAKVKGGRKP